MAHYLLDRSGPSVTNWLDGERVAQIMLVLVCIISVAGAFTYLDRSSFWVDELWSAYFIQGSFSDVFEKTLRFDVHPPLYSLILKSWSLLFGTSETDLRLLSAVAAAATAPALYTASRSVLSRWAALLLVAMCVTSLFWFDKSQEARSYALALLGSAFLLGGLTRAVTATTRQHAWHASIWIAASALPVSFLHFYSFLTSGAVIAIGTLLLGDRKARTLLLAAGVSIFWLMVLYIAVRHGRNVISAKGSWLDQASMSGTTYIRFLVDFAGSLPGSLLILLSGATATVSLFKVRSRIILEVRNSPALKAACAALAVAAIVLAVVVTLVFAGVPTISDRNLAITLPFLWFAVAAVADWSGDRHSRCLRVWQMFISTALMILASGTVLYRPVPHREDWRSAARSITSNASCVNTTIFTVSGPNLLRLNGISYRRAFFSYYAPSMSFRAMSGAKLASGDEFHDLIARARDIVAGRQPCRVVLWSAHGLKEAEGVVVEKKIAAALGSDGKRVRLEPFPHYDLRFSRPVDAVFLISVAPPDRTKP